MVTAIGVQSQSIGSRSNEARSKEEPFITTDRVVLTQKNDLALIPRNAVLAVSKQEEPAPPQSPVRPMTEGEKADFKSYFPALDVEKAVVSGEATMAYNCISWTVGETHQWFWPPYMYPESSEEEAFDKFYASYGLKPSPQGEVAKWRNDQGLTHGCVSGPDHGPRWESKCGGSLKIQHDLNELESEVYGKVDGFYTKDESTPPPVNPPPPEVPEPVKMRVREMAARVSPGLRSEFENQYAKWKEFRADPRVSFSPNPADYCKTGAFRNIVDLGTGVVPLLMEKISEGDFLSLQAVDALKQRSPKLNRLRLSSEEQSQSEQGRAAATLARWAM
ncbi:MAG: hypothetical protein HYU64_09455 [Armatimonadetes bacterium]|nr:hypothetical protein [Armatimonadota bacterium]